MRVESKVQPVSGVSERRYWHARVVDFAKLPDEYKLPDTVKLGKLAREWKDKAMVPGAEFWSDTDMAARGS